MIKLYKAVIMVLSSVAITAIIIMLCYLSPLLAIGITLMGLVAIAYFFVVENEN